MKLDVRNGVIEEPESGASAPTDALLWPRRRFLKSTMLAGLSAAGALAAAAGCSKSSGNELSCNELDGLSAGEVATRTAMSYVDRSLFPDKLCSNCALYIEAATDGACGSCKLAKGPINPNGYCTGWAPKTAQG